MDGPARTPGHASHRRHAADRRREDASGRRHSCGPRAGDVAGQQHGFRLQARNQNIDSRSAGSNGLRGNRNPSAVRRLPGLCGWRLAAIHSFEIADDSHIATQILPGEAWAEYFSHVISRRRAPIDVEHVVTLSSCGPCVALRPDGEFWLRDRLFEDELSNTLIVVRDKFRNHTLHYLRYLASRAQRASATRGRAVAAVRNCDRRKPTMRRCWNSKQTMGRAASIAARLVPSGGALHSFLAAPPIRAGVLMGLVGQAP